MNDGFAKIEAGELLKLYLKGERKTWDWNRLDTVGSSEVFTCLRRVWYGKTEAPVDPGYEENRGAMERGNLIEAHYVIPGLQSQLPPGLKLYRCGAEQMTLLIGRLSATPDGVLVNEGNYPVEVDGLTINPMEAIAIEFKSIDPRVNLQEAKQHHWGQNQVQIGMFKREGVFKVVGGLILYVNASFLDEVSTFVVMPDDRVFIRATERADQVFATTNPTEIRPEGKIAGGQECEHCPWYELCAADNAGRVPDYPPQGEKKKSLQRPIPSQAEAELAEAIAIAEGLKRQYEAMEPQVAAARESVKELLRKIGIRAYKAVGWSVTWSQVAGRSSLDVEAMKADGINVDQYKKAGVPGERLVLKSDGSV